ncbi:2,3-bisphosphoglycerate-independent phosphoglycerate mutase [Methylobacillus sp. Pita2]|uniref:2,3-bisphosphoglycerate-independent phosphoglycerate mutase n=1 Tax=Methylobacillus sp. Pita2 TaxID=3383245 RepID=UPI0038B4E794
MTVTPALLVILDGFGYREDSHDNAIALANTPNIDRFWAQYPHTLINASETFVGLPSGQMGNSEVGHLNIGAGRVVFQDFERINRSIASREFFSNPVLVEAADKAKAAHKAVHILGLVSDGGVHSHQDHIHATIEMAVKAGVEKVYVHAFLDGRDTPPISARPYLEKLEQACARIGGGKIASICGRFYAMDRDKRWPRVEAAYNLITDGQGEFAAATALQGLEAAYARDEKDEFVKATAIAAAGEQPVTMEDGDVVIFVNFRSDRARQLTHALLDPDFEGFNRRRQPKLAGFYTLTLYDKAETRAKPIFAPVEIRNTFGEYVAQHGLTQLRIAETEKYPHVTFFFNGGEEQVFNGEDRILVPSPKVATYDLQPEMSAYEMTDKLEAAILSRKYDAIICNYANCDMVGHSGDLNASIKAVETIDTCIARIVKAMESIGGQMIITADHGNVEQMRDYENNQPHTQHTTNQVPLFFIGKPATLAAPGTGSLCDLAPTLLAMMGLKQPPEMTGKSLVTFQAA